MNKSILGVMELDLDEIGVLDFKVVYNKTKDELTYFNTKNKKEVKGETLIVLGELGVMLGEYDSNTGNVSYSLEDLKERKFGSYMLYDNKETLKNGVSTYLTEVSEEDEVYVLNMSLTVDYVCVSVGLDEVYNLEDLSISIKESDIKELGIIGVVDKNIVELNYYAIEVFEMLVEEYAYLERLKITNVTRKEC